MGGRKVHKLSKSKKMEKFFRQTRDEYEKGEFC